MKFPHAVWIDVLVFFGACQLGCGGAIEAECKDGFVLVDGVCLDLNECSGEGNGHDCHPEARCTNSEGSYFCECNQGYQGDGKNCERIRQAGLILKNITLIDGNGGPPVSESIVVITEGRLAEVGLDSGVFVYPDDQVVDMQRRVVMPGVINAHVHQASSVDNLEAWAQAGVTTVREVGAPLSPPAGWDGIEDWDDWAAAILGGASVEDLVPPSFAIRDEELDRPESARVLMAGPCLTANEGYPRGSLSLHVNLETVIENEIEISPVEDARRKAQVLVAAGADVIKICLENYWGTNDWGLLTQEQIEAIVEVAHQSGIRVTAHVSADEQLTKCLGANPPIDDAAHMVTDSISDQNITDMVEGGVIQVPTLAVWESLSWICTDYGMCQEVENLNRLVEAGGQIALGDDYGNEEIPLGMPIHEMELMQQAGMSNMEIIVAATKNSAAACGLLDELGTVEAGKLADLIVLNADPLTDIAALTDIAYVIRDGQIIRGSP